VTSVVLKLGASTRTMYVPGMSEPEENVPADVALVVTLALVSLLIIVILALGSAPPSGSVITP
jgi:hypothetical protein